ncbi:MAG: hypothetical protein CO093_07590 [Alphaproteobacteria bacterium CG_4_9_14_3_um_filter_47_13]|nr:MAG: hypothetical protein CO093_07590 [Alphaproteobacteria bacterium CG_4_9_14_3_um_filter_47_13]
MTLLPNENTSYRLEQLTQNTKCGRDMYTLLRASFQAVRPLEGKAGQYADRPKERELFSRRMANDIEQALLAAKKNMSPEFNAAVTNSLPAIKDIITEFVDHYTAKGTHNSKVRQNLSANILDVVAKTLEI